MGEDLTRVTNSICTSMFNSLFFTFVTVGLISFGLLFSICCMVCTGIQHYKDFEKRKSKDIDKELMKERDTTAAIMDL